MLSMGDDGKRSSNPSWSSLHTLDLPGPGHPATVDRAKLAGFRAAGATRVSFGVESLEPEELRALRAVEVLEAIATPAAREHLAQLAEGEPNARLTRDAAGAVRRARRP